MTWLDLLLLTLQKLGASAVAVGPYLPALLLAVVWCAWWLGGVNWIKFWPVLAQGAWLPAVLLAVITATVWTQLEPGRCECLGFVTIPNGWWQTGAVSLLVAVALFCGWLQGYFGWMPPEISVEPPAPAADHGHAHGHH